jgi:enamine deaminase RidA (YjgF/YER057c/UK114 family)
MLTNARPDRSPDMILQDLGITLPVPTAPAGPYVPCVQVGPLVFVSGQVPMRDGKVSKVGRVGVDVTVEEGIEAAKLCAIHAIAALKSHADDLSRVQCIVRVGVFVACDPGFGDQPKVANGASDLLVRVFGEAGRHARAAVGVASLPFRSPVEVELLAELSP